MNIDIQILIGLYKEEVMKLQNENVVLKAQVIQLKKDMEEMKKKESISGDDE